MARIVSRDGRVLSAIVLLATSRERMYLSAEIVYRLPSLPEADSIALFIARAASADVQYAICADGVDHALLVRTIRTESESLPGDTQSTLDYVCTKLRESLPNERARRTAEL
jgi:hypothetical protein